MIKISDKYCIVLRGGNVAKYAATTIKCWEENKDKDIECCNYDYISPYKEEYACGNTVEEVIKDLIKNIIGKNIQDKNVHEIKDVLKEVKEINYFEI